MQMMSEYIEQECEIGHSYWDVLFFQCSGYTMTAKWASVQGPAHAQSLGQWGVVLLKEVHKRTDYYTGYLANTFPKFKASFTFLAVPKNERMLCCLFTLILCHQLNMTGEKKKNHFNTLCHSDASFKVECFLNAWANDMN